MDEGFGKDFYRKGNSVKNKKSGDTSCFFPIKRSTRDSPKIPATFQCRSPGKYEKNIYNMFLWRGVKVTITEITPSVATPLSSHRREMDSKPEIAEKWLAKLPAAIFWGGPKMAEKMAGQMAGKTRKRPNFSYPAIFSAILVSLSEALSPVVPNVAPRTFSK